MSPTHQKKALKIEMRYPKLTKIVIANLPKEGFQK